MCPLEFSKANIWYSHGKPPWGLFIFLFFPRNLLTSFSVPLRMVWYINSSKPFNWIFPVKRRKVLTHCSFPYSPLNWTEGERAIRWLHSKSRLFCVTPGNHRIKYSLALGAWEQLGTWILRYTGKICTWEGA